MKKIIIAIVAVALVAACAAGAYFAFFNDKAPSNDIEVVPDDFVEGVFYIEAIVKNPERYKTVIGPEYGMDEAKVAEFFAAPEEWFSYEKIITITNIGENDFTVYGYEVKDNGKNGVYVSTSLGGELGLPVGGTTTISFSILAHGDLSFEEVKETVSKMDVNVVYTKSPVEYDDGTVSVEETLLAPANYYEAK